VTTPLFHRLADLEGRVAVITGGAGYIGFEMARAFAELGCAVVLSDVAAHCQDRAETLATETGAKTLGVRADLARDGAIDELVGTVEGRFGRLDILVNNAAFVGSARAEGWASSFETQSPRTFADSLDVNVRVPFQLVQTATPLLRASGHGSVVNVSSIYGLVGPDLRIYEHTQIGNPAGYAAGKAALLQLTRWLSTVLAPEVRVNALTPGGVERGQPQSFIERYCARTPLQRMAREQDLVGAAVYLASDLSSYVTGQNLVVDGGWTAW
jgi:NAD(P)-dependent dehydrogenase (short-subunit alcohol dehydrogenase family)